MRGASVEPEDKPPERTKTPINTWLPVVQTVAKCLEVIALWYQLLRT